MTSNEVKEADGTKVLSATIPATLDAENLSKSATASHLSPLASRGVAYRVFLHLAWIPEVSVVFMKSTRAHSHLESRAAVIPRQRRPRPIAASHASTSRHDDKSSLSSDRLISGTVLLINPRRDAMGSNQPSTSTSSLVSIISFIRSIIKITPIDLDVLQ